MKNLTLYVRKLKKEEQNETATVKNSNLSWTGVPETQERKREWGKGDNERDPGWEFSRSDEKHQFINSKSQQNK